MMLAGELSGQMNRGANDTSYLKPAGQLSREVISTNLTRRMGLLPSFKSESAILYYIRRLILQVRPP